jgi:capsule synthesis protein PGA_cap
MRACSWRAALVVLLSTSIVLGQTSRQDSRPLSAPFRLCAGGDVTLGTNLDPTWARYAADTLWRQYGIRPEPDSIARALKPLLAGADVVLLNVEGAIGAGPVAPKCGPRSKNCFAFRQPKSAAGALRRLADSGVVIVGNIANNHSRDAGDDGRDSTVASLDAAGVYVTGRDTLATAVPLPSGDTIGILGFYTDTTAPDARDLAAVRRHVARAVDRYGTVIVTMHLGAEGVTAQRTRNAVEKFLKLDRGNPVGFANAAFAGGATLVIGHGPHVLRAAEWHGDRLVFYSLGNLLTYGPFRLREPTNRGVIACTTVDAPGHVAQAELRATMQRWTGVLEPDSSRRAFILIDSLSRLDFPASGVRVDTAGIIGRRGIPISKPQ